MVRPAQITCPICGRTLQESRFVVDRSNEETGRSAICMDCMCTGVDNRRPSTFLHILQHFDLPFIERTWAKMTNKAYQKGPMSFGPTSVVGKYLKAMHMAQFAGLHFADSDRMVAGIEIERPPQICEIWGEPYQFVLEEGEDAPESVFEDPEARKARKAAEARASNVRTAQLTLDVARDPEPEQEAEEPEPQDRRGMLSGLDPALTQENDAIIMNSLTKEDQTYLIGKWGAYYTPSQWVKMERMYDGYAREYELNVDREETLKKICSTSVKMDEALEMGDVNAYKNLSAVYGQLRKDGKFTEAQNKTDVVRPFDTIGEIVRLCEDEGGPIPDWGDPDLYPQDQLDLVLNDYKAYVYHLVKNEMGLGQIIERYVEDLERAERDKENAMLRSLRGDLTAEDIDANAARMNLADAIRREAEQLAYADNSQYHSKMRYERGKALGEVADDVSQGDDRGR